jgi:hypothetical protein
MEVVPLLGLKEEVKELEVVESPPTQPQPALLSPSLPPSWPTSWPPTPPCSPTPEPPTPAPL